MKPQAKTTGPDKDAKKIRSPRELKLALGGRRLCPKSSTYAIAKSTSPRSNEHTDLDEIVATSLNHNQHIHPTGRYQKS